MNYAEVVPRVAHVVALLPGTAKEAGLQVLRIAEDVSQRRRIGGSMQSFAIDSQYRVQLGRIVEARQLFCSRSLPVLHLADALLAELSGSPTEFAEAMEDADRALAMWGL